MTPSSPGQERPVRVLAMRPGIAGGYACRLLADAGASVRVVVPDSGLWLQGWTPSGTPAAAGLLFRHLLGDAGQVSADGPDVDAALAVADVVLIDRIDGGDPDSGLASALAVAAERAVVVDLSLFGSHQPAGPRPANEFSLQAACGSTGWRGIPGQRPIPAGGRLGEWAAGLFGAIAAVAGLAARAASGAGTRCDVSLFETMVAVYNPFEWLRTGFYDPPRDFGLWLDLPATERVSDGWVGITCITPDQWRALLQVTGGHEFEGDRSLELLLGRVSLRERFDEVCGRWLRAHTAEEVLTALAGHKIPSTPVGNGQTLPDMEHFQTRGMYVTAADGSYVAPASPIILDGQRLSATGPGPLRDFPPGQTSIDHPAAGQGADGAARPPLAGLRVLDLGAFWAGPGCAQILGNLGADVLKVEGVGRPDGMRLVAALGRGVPHWYEYNGIYQGTHAGKRTTAIDLDTTKGRELVMRLAASADVVVENYPAGVMDRHGITYAELSQRNPRLIMARMPAFGSTGPWRQRRGYATTVDQLSGTSWVTGESGGAPVGVKSFGDFNGSAHAALAVLFALARRASTGTGGEIEVALAEAALAATADQVLEFSATGTLLTRTGSRRADAAPQGIYRSGDDRWVALAVLDDTGWRRLTAEFAQVLPWCPGDYPTLAERSAAADEIDRGLAAAVLAAPAHTTVQRLRALGVAAEIVHSSAVTDEDPDLLASGFMRLLPHPVHGPIRCITLPFTMDGQRYGPGTSAPLYGADNDCLVELGVVSVPELAALRAAGTVADEPRFAPLD
jgi:crotonobetainyl-CoA:carnitine CoA-transferase CaiB-like acyl-CoA transferase